MSQYKNLSDGIDAVAGCNAAAAAKLLLRNHNDLKHPALPCDSAAWHHQQHSLPASRYGADKWHNGTNQRRCPRSTHAHGVKHAPFGKVTTWTATYLQSQEEEHAGNFVIADQGVHAPYCTPYTSTGASSRPLMHARPGGLHARRHSSSRCGRPPRPPPICVLSLGPGHLLPPATSLSPAQPALP